MEEGKVSESHLTSAAAFVEGGVQDACDDACSICLEAFCDSDPLTVTSCKHEFHLQCVLEWCQRSSHCPMCWQAISLKDPSSQELLEAVEHERNVRMNPPRTSTIFRHPTLGDFELQHLPVNASESELEERIIQHLAAAAAMGRARQLASREGRSRSASQRPHYLLLSTHGNGASATSPALPLVQRDGSGLPPAAMVTGPNSPQLIALDDSSQLTGLSASSAANHLIDTASGSSAGVGSHGTSSNNRRSPSQTTPPSSQDRAGPSDLQSFSESLKSRFNALSTRYKETITKSTKSWKERLFARNSSPDSSSKGSREANQSITNNQNMATMARMMDHLQIAEEGTTTVSTPPYTTEVETTTIPRLPAEMLQQPTGTEEIAQSPPAAAAVIPASD